MTATTPDALATGTQAAWRRWLRRHGWTFGVWILLVALIAYYSTLIPAFGSFQFASIINNGAPLVFLAAAQAVIVIAGGIDLGVGGIAWIDSTLAPAGDLDADGRDDLYVGARLGHGPWVHTEGVVRAPSSFAITLGWPPSITATTEFVVPRSIPTALAMLCASTHCGCWLVWRIVDPPGQAKAPDDVRVAYLMPYEYKT